jgi:hypothetical protein
VLLPRMRRPGLLAELRSRCAAAGIECEIRRGTEVSKRTRVAILTTPPHLDDHAFAELSRWMFVYLGSRPFDPVEAAAEDRRRREEVERAGPDRTWTSRELKFIVGRIVKREFLDGVEAICASNGVRWDWRVDRKRVALTLVIAISGPTYLVEAAADQLRKWQARFGIVTGS